MIYVFNKNKIFSYVIASFIVIALFTFSSSIIPDKDIQIVKISSNVVQNNTDSTYKEYNESNINT